ncbi:DUF6578 domain-containing protein [Actinoplanes subtropicus]|uniref:DUF6578 domain-containing protein n=1 Tax=Actinoplanes subtropicus TaxID=543632 RepID=UPI003CCB7461
MPVPGRRSPYGGGGRGGLPCRARAWWPASRSPPRSCPRPAEQENGVVEIKVWVDDWQMQCCGAPFAVGDEVS